MNKRDIIINISPFAWWMLTFIFGIFGFGKFELTFYTQMIVFFLLPMFISIYNTIGSDDCGDLCIKSIFMGASNIIGIIFSSALSNSFVEYDPEMEPILSLLLGVAFIYTLLLTLICCSMKKLLKKRR